MPQSFPEVNLWPREGWVVSVALTLREATVAGFDTDAAAIAAARRAAAIAGVTDRVTFEVADQIHGDAYDLVYAGITRPA